MFCSSDVAHLTCAYLYATRRSINCYVFRYCHIELCILKTFTFWVLYYTTELNVTSGFNV